jgi:hypothetical protein
MLTYAAPSAINLDIALDRNDAPVPSVLASFFRRHEKNFRRLADLIYYVGFFVSIILMWLEPSVSRALFLVLYVLVALLRFLGLNQRAWGEITYASTKRAAHFASVKLMDTVGALQHRTIADEYGRYYLFSPFGRHVLRVESQDPVNHEPLSVDRLVAMKERSGIITEQIVLSERQSASHGVLWKILIGGILSAIIASGVWYFWQRLQETSLSELESSIAAADPIGPFWEKFLAGNYQVQVDSRASSGQTLYFEKGELVRVGDPSIEAGRTYAILKKGKLYSIAAAEKTFQEFPTDVDPGQSMAERLKEASLLAPIMHYVENRRFSWQQDGDGLIAKEKWSLQDGNGSVKAVTVRITLDPVTGLLSSISLKEDGKDWQSTRFQFQSISNLSDLKMFPFDYRRVN